MARRKSSSSKRRSGSKAKLGSGGRSRALKRKGLSGPLIGYLGRKKYGKKRMAKWSAQGRKRKARSRSSSRKRKR